MLVQSSGESGSEHVVVVVDDVVVVVVVIVLKKIQSEFNKSLSYQPFKVRFL